jgi:type I restriction enzyme S subunit
MSAGWRSTTVQEFVDRGEAELKTGPFGTQLHASDYVEHGTPVINVRNIGFGTIVPEKLEYISEATVSRLSSHLLQADDIVFGRKGAVERHAFLKSGHDRWFQGSDCLRLRASGPNLVPRFLSYCFLTEDHKQWMMNQCSHGATMASLNQAIICRIPFRLPPPTTQRHIADVLSAYDDLIENNTRRIKILEEMAQMIYREWFVNFRFPGHEKARMVESELGPIPKGWTAKRLGDVAGVNKHSIKSSLPPEEIHYIDIASVSTAKIDRKEPMRFADAPGRARRIVRPGDTIWSTVRPNRRSYALILNPEPNLIVSTGFAVLTAETVSYSYLYFATTTDEFADYLTNHATGSAYPAVTGKDFENAPLLVPNESIGNRFHELTGPMLDLSWNLHQRNINLRKTRDFLLPKLISGEVPVEAADEAAAELMGQTA